LDALEAGLPARRVAEVGAALVGAISRERVDYGGRAADAVLPPARLERLAVALGQVGALAGRGGPGRPSLAGGRRGGGCGPVCVARA
jgi:hypothetical protein